MATLHDVDVQGKFYISKSINSRKLKFGRDGFEVGLCIFVEKKKIVKH